VGDIGYAFGLVTAPTLEPVAIDEAKLDRRMTLVEEDGAVERWIRSARSRIEQYLKRGLLTQTWKLALDEFLDEVPLPMAAPLQSVTTIKYYDASGMQQTLSSSVYQVDTLSEPGRVLLAVNQSWPTIQADRALGVEITYVVGWATVEAIPPDIVDAHFLLIGERDEFRSDTIAGMSVSKLPAAAEALLAPHRRWWREPQLC
jgi:uncharacterized phiE125 gp8 family phage protein